MNDTDRELGDLKLEEKVIGRADKRYAIKLIERIVFGILALFGTAIVLKLIQLINL